MRKNRTRNRILVGAIVSMLAAATATLGLAAGGAPNPGLGQLHVGPGVGGFGYYPTIWREWPCEARQDKLFPGSVGREVLPPPPPGPPAEHLPTPPPDLRPEAPQGYRPYVPGEGALPSESGILAPDVPVLPEDRFRSPSGLPGLEEPAEPGLPETPAAPGGILPGAPMPGGILPVPPTPGGAMPRTPGGVTPGMPGTPGPARPVLPRTPGLPSDLEGLPLDPMGRQGPPSSGAEASGLTYGPRRAGDSAGVAPVQFFEPSPERLPRGTMRAVWEPPTPRDAPLPAQAGSPPGQTPVVGGRAAQPAWYVAQPATAWEEQRGLVQPQGYQRSVVESAEDARQAVHHQPLAQPPVAPPVAPPTTPFAEPPTAPPAMPAASVPPLDGALADARAALDGYCPVELGKNEKWVAGDPRWSCVHEGRTYHFSSPVQRECFLVDPDRYAPTGGGADPVLLREQGRQVAGKLEYCVTYDGRLYMFSDAASLARFRRDPQRYTVE